MKVKAPKPGCKCILADLDIMDKPPRSPTEGLVSPWTFVRWMVVGCYVGFATVAAFAFWYMFDNVLGVDLSQDGHSTVTWYQLTHYNQCSDWPEFQVCVSADAAVSLDCPCLASPHFVAPFSFPFHFCLLMWYFQLLVMTVKADEMSRGHKKECYVTHSLSDLY